MGIEASTWLQPYPDGPSVSHRSANPLRLSPFPSMSASLPSRANLDLLESKYEEWKLDAAKVEPSWAAFFEGFELGLAQSRIKTAGPGAEAVRGSAAFSEEELNFRMRVSNAIHNFRALGHTAAWLDPLASGAPQQLTLEPAGLGFAVEELDTDVVTHLFAAGRRMKLREMLAELRRIYCDKIGFEVMHIHNPEVRGWLLDRIENRLG